MDDDLALFFGVNAQRLARLDAANVAGTRPFCWPALLFPQAWLLYRKMYGWAAVASAGPLVFLLFPQAYYLTSLASLAGFFGLPLYFSAARRTIESVRAEAASEGEARAWLARAGGVSWTGGAFGVLYAFATLILALKTGAK